MIIPPPPLNRLFSPNLANKLLKTNVFQKGEGGIFQENKFPCKNKICQHLI